jgi:hypothetical protein
MILALIVRIILVAAVALRKVIAIAPRSRWSRHITSHNTCKLQVVACLAVTMPIVFILGVRLWWTGFRAGNHQQLCSKRWCKCRADHVIGRA